MSRPEASLEQIRNAFDRAVYGAERRAWIIGLLGMVNTDGTTTIHVPDRLGWVFVTTGPTGAQMVTIARNDGKVPIRAQMPVRMKRGDNGALVIHGVFNEGGFTDSGLSGDYTNNFGTEWHHHRIGSGLEFEFEGLMHERGRARPTSGMLAYMNSFRYYYGSVWKTWTGNTIDLTSYKPATSGHWAWVVIGVDPETNAATATTGPSVPYATALTYTDVNDVAFEGIPVAAVKVRDDSASIMDMSLFADVHEWFSGLHYSKLGDLGNVDESEAYYGGLGPYWNDELYYYGYGGYGWLAGGHKLNMGAVQVHTVSNGYINIAEGPTFGLFDIRGEGDANDDLVWIQNGQVGDVICLFASAPGTYGEITVKNTGNVNLAADFAIDATSKVLILVFTPSGWKQMSGAGDSGTTATVAVPKSLEIYIDKKERLAEEDMHGGVHALTTGAALDSVPTNINVTAGISKILVLVNAGSDFAGTITVTGTSVDRDTKAETPADTDTLVIDALTTDSSGTDGNGNTTHAWTGAYITGKWFKGAITLSTTDLTLTDVDVYQVAFEQFDSAPNLVLDSLDVSGEATNASAWASCHMYSLEIGTGDKCNVTKEATVEILSSAVSANKWYRLREGNIAKTLDGTTDGIWVECFFGPLANVYWEDINVKVWYTETVGVSGSITADLTNYLNIADGYGSIPNSERNSNVPLHLHQESAEASRIWFSNEGAGGGGVWNSDGLLVGLNYNGYDGQIWLYYDGTIYYGVNNATTFAMNSNGFGYMQNNPQHGLDINDDTIRLHTSRTPASATATGSKGEICWDSNYIYVCTATNTWKRTAISTW